MDEKNDLRATAETYAGSLLSAINTTVEFIRSGDLQKGLQLIGDICEGLQWEINAVALLKDELIEKIDPGSINENLLGIVTAMENSDYVLVCDILEYEVIAVLEDWKRKLDNFGLPA